MRSDRSDSDRAQVETHVGGRAFHEHLGGAFVEAALDAGEASLGGVALLACGLQVGGDLFEPAGGILETLQHRGELGLDRRELPLRRGQLLLGGAAFLAGFLHLLLGRRGATGRGGRDQGDERGRDRDDAERHGEGVVRSGHM
jgi:hypothetical protein